MAIYHLSMKTAAGAATPKINYITRDGKYLDKREEDFVMAKSHNIPDWANNEKDFWSEMDNQEKNSSYREIVIALPRELSTEEQVKCVDAFCKENLDGHALTYAIHENNGKLAGGSNPHVHIVFNERKQDGREVPREKFCRQRSGFAKNREITGSHRKEWLKNARESWANIANRALERNGIDEKIDHRSYKERGIDKVPTVHVGRGAIVLEKRGTKTRKFDDYIEAKKTNIELTAENAIKRNTAKISTSWKEKLKARANLIASKLKIIDIDEPTPWADVTERMKFEQRQRDIISGKRDQDLKEEIVAKARGQKIIEEYQLKTVVDRVRNANAIKTRKNAVFRVDEKTNENSMARKKLRDERVKKLEKEMKKAQKKERVRSRDEGRGR